MFSYKHGQGRGRPKSSEDSLWSLEGRKLWELRINGGWKFRKPGRLTPTKTSLPTSGTSGFNRVRNIGFFLHPSSSDPKTGHSQKQQEA